MRAMQVCADICVCCAGSELHLGAAEALLGAGGGVPHFDEAVSFLADVQPHEEEAALQQHHVHNAAHLHLAVTLQGGRIYIFQGVGA